MGTTRFDSLGKKSYADVRSQIKSGDILFASGNYSISQMIRYVSDSLFSHVGVVFLLNSRVMLFESVEDDGVRVIPLSQYVSNYENSDAPYDGRLFLGRCNDEIDENSINKMFSKAVELLNRKYDVEDISRILISITIGIIAHQEKDTYICSEFLDVCFKEIGFLFPRAANGFIFPEHIAADPNVTPLFEIVP